MFADRQWPVGSTHTYSERRGWNCRHRDTESLVGLLNHSRSISEYYLKFGVADYFNIFATNTAACIVDVEFASRPTHVMTLVCQACHRLPCSMRYLLTPEKDGDTAFPISVNNHSPVYAVG
jgi:hypothetical protein